jgi:Concanavalin A-like lectin/glucanases superfamily
MSIPNVTVEFAPGLGPFDSRIGNWVEIPAEDVLSVTGIGEGRGSEFDDFAPNPCTITLDNSARTYDPEYEDGPYFGMLNPRTPFQVRVDDGYTTDLYVGFAQTWSCDYRPPGDGTCTVPLTDALGVFADYPIPGGSAWASEVLSDSPLVWWRLDETGGTQMADSSGNGLHGVYRNSILGQDPLHIGAEHCTLFPRTGENYARWSGDSLPKGAPLTIEAWVRLEPGSTTRSIVGAQVDSATTPRIWVRLSSASDAVVIRNVGLTLVGTRDIDNRRPFHIAVTIAGTATSDHKLYINGVEDPLTVDSGTVGGTWDTSRIWTIGNALDDLGAYGLGGEVSDVAVYGSVLSAATIADHYAAGTTAFEGELIGERINRVLDTIGYPDTTEFRDISSGPTQVGPATYGDSTVLRYIQGIVAAEQGEFYCNHHIDGRVTFYDRYARYVSASLTSPVYTFTDAVDAGDTLHYERDGLTVQPNGISGIINTVKVEWVGGTEVVTDTASVAAYGPRSWTLDTYAPTPQAARSAGEWVIALYAQPRARIRSLKLRPDADPRLAQAASEIRVGDYIQVVRSPLSIGATVTSPCFVEGVTRDFPGGPEYQVSVDLSPADAVGTIWIWGTSTWGETTVWG